MHTRSIHRRTRATHTALAVLSLFAAAGSAQAFE